MSFRKLPGVLAPQKQKTTASGFYTRKFLEVIMYSSMGFVPIVIFLWAGLTYPELQYTFTFIGGGAFIALILLYIFRMYRLSQQFLFGQWALWKPGELGETEHVQIEGHPIPLVSHTKEEIAKLKLSPETRDQAFNMTLLPLHKATGDGYRLVCAIHEDPWQGEILYGRLPSFFNIFSFMTTGFIWDVLLVEEKVYPNGERVPYVQIIASYGLAHRLLKQMERMEVTQKMIGNAQNYFEGFLAAPQVQRIRDLEHLLEDTQQHAEEVEENVDVIVGEKMEAFLKTRRHGRLLGVRKHWKLTVFLIILFALVALGIILLGVRR